MGSELQGRLGNVARRLRTCRLERFPTAHPMVGWTGALGVTIASSLRRKVKPWSLAVRLRELTGGRCMQFTAATPESGRIEVVDIGRERRLVLNGEVASIYFTRGSQGALRNEYWGAIARPPALLPKHPRVLLLGLGGASILHLLSAEFGSFDATVIELDPVIIACARNFFGLSVLGSVTILQGCVSKMTERLASTGERFDYIVDDVYFEPDGLPADERLRLWRRYASLVRPGGMFAVNIVLEDSRKIGQLEEEVGVLRSDAYEISTVDVIRRFRNRIYFVRPPAA